LYTADTNFSLQQPIRSNNRAQTGKTTAGKANQIRKYSSE
jgi:hypothetical protein